ncbi:S8 family serine peptidase [bacterium]|nr:S8 family serine peptidase [bacterium]
MTNRKQIKILATLTLFLAPLAFSMQGAAVGSLDQAIDGEFIIKLKEGVRLNDAQIFSESGVRLSRKVNNGSGLVVGKLNKSQAIRSLGVDSMISSQGLSKEIAKSLSMLPGVEYAEPNYLYRVAELNLPSMLKMTAPVEDVASNDPMLGQLWGMSFIDAQEAWQVHTGNGDVVVAVVDTGVDYNHVDLNANMWSGQDENGNVIHGYNAINDALDPMDDHYHGTHVAGTIAGIGNNEVGVAGVAWRAQIMGVKFLSASGSGSLEGAIKAIDWATEHGAQIMNNSWGGGGYSEALKESIERAEAANILFVAAAGNSSADNDAEPAYPASYDVPNVVSVAAIADDGSLASFSSYGKRSVHIAAPGVNIQSTSTNNSYKSLSGTSMACPHVVGAAVLMLDYDSEMNYADLKERLIASSVKNSGLKKKVANGGAVLNINNMLRGVFPPGPIPVPDWKWSDLIPQTIETAHPYLDNSTKSWEIEIAGATHYKLHFARFETETRYDTLTIKNAETGAILDTISGTLPEDYWTDELEATKLLIEFKADHSVSRWGFQMDAFKWAEFNPEGEI